MALVIDHGINFERKHGLCADVIRYKTSLLLFLLYYHAFFFFRTTNETHGDGEKKGRVYRVYNQLPLSL